MKRHDQDSLRRCALAAVCQPDAGGRRHRSCAGHADAAEPAAELRAVDQDVQALKKQLVDLNRDLFKLEEEILYPASTQVAVFLSLNVGTFFALDSVTLKLDDKEVANQLYTEREVQALQRGGVQKLYLGNLKAGPARAGGVLHRQGPARPRLPARHDAVVREDRRRQVRRAADQRPGVVAAAGVRRQAVGVGRLAAGRCAGSEMTRA